MLPSWRLGTWLSVRAAVASALLLCAAPYAVAAESASEAEENAGGAEGEEEAVTTSGTSAARTLAERIPSVTRRSFVKSGRVELFPAVGMTLNDPFFNNVLFTGGLLFHATEWLAIGAAGDYVLGLPAHLPVVAGDARQRPEANHPSFAGRLELAFSPLYGKISLFAEQVLHFDIYAVLGGGMVGTALGKPTMGAVAGVGEHVFLGKWLALRIELRDQIFRMSIDDLPTTSRSLRHLLMASLGLCLYLPTDFEDETL